mgnify:CR=1 FL=1
MLVETPLSIDTLDPVAMEIALKNYPGRALINSVNGGGGVYTHVMPLAKRYGAALLACQSVVVTYLKSRGPRCFS